MCTNNNCSESYPCSSCEESACNEVSSCREGCINETNANCVQYTGEDLENINVESGDWLEDILIKLNSTDTIVATANGTNGHSPYYNVRIDPTDNAITKSAAGLKVSLSQILQGKVKVNAADSLDYLDNQIFAGTDGIITVTPTVVGGAIYLVPSINKEALMALIEDEICAIASSCIPEGESTTTTTSTSTTSTSTTSTTSTTTTTLPSNDFTITNLAGQGIFDITLRDELSFITYVNDNLTNSGQSAAFTYNGTTNQSEIVIQHLSNVPVGVNVKVDGVVVYNQLLYLGSVTIQNLDAQSDIEVILYPYAGTTTTTTSTTTSSTTTTTPSINCVTYSITNTTGSSKSLEYEDCEGTPLSTLIGDGVTFEICAVQGSVIAGTGVTVTEINDECSTTTTTSSTTTTTTTTSSTTSTTTDTSTTTSTTSTTTTTVAPVNNMIIDVQNPALDSQIDNVIPSFYIYDSGMYSFPIDDPDTFEAYYGASMGSGITVSGTSGAAGGFLILKKNGVIQQSIPVPTGSFSETFTPVTFTDPDLMEIIYSDVSL
jgi:hypothetical protein